MLPPLFPLTLVNTGQGKYLPRRRNIRSFICTLFIGRQAALDGAARGHKPLLRYLQNRQFFKKTVASWHVSNYQDIRKVVKNNSPANNNPLIMEVFHFYIYNKTLFLTG